MRVAGPQPASPPDDVRLPTAAIVIIAVASAALLAAAIAIILRLHCACCSEAPCWWWCCRCCWCTRCRILSSDAASSPCKPTRVLRGDSVAEPRGNPPPDVVVRIRARRNGKGEQTIVPRAAQPESPTMVERRRQQQRRLYAKARPSLLCVVPCRACACLFSPGSSQHFL